MATEAAVQFTGEYREDVRRDQSDYSGRLNEEYSAKLKDALLAVVRKSYATWEKTAGADLPDLSAEIPATGNSEGAVYTDAPAGKAGYLNYKQLEESGSELSSSGFAMTESDFSTFNELAKRNGFCYTGLWDRNGYFQLVYQAKDSGLLNRCMNRLDNEKISKHLEERVLQLKTGEEKENLNVQEQAELETSKKGAEKLRRGYCDELNTLTCENALKRAFGEGVSEEFPLGKTLDSMTGREIDRDQNSVIADAGDPSKYIICHGRMESFRNRPYVMTEYDVYKDGKLVLQADDRRFQGRPAGYWEQQKAAMQAAGGFGSTFFKFYNSDEFDSWAGTAREQNSNELNTLDRLPGTCREAVSELNKQLDQYGVSYQNGTVFSKKTQEPYVLNPEMTGEEKLTAAKTALIGEQIRNCNLRDSLTAELMLAEAGVLTAEEGSAEYRGFEIKRDHIRKELEEAGAAEQKLVMQRKELNGVQAEQRVRVLREYGEPEDQKNSKIRGSASGQMTMQQIKTEITRRRALTDHVTEAGAGSMERNAGLIRPS